MMDSKQRAKRNRKHLESHGLACPSCGGREILPGGLERVTERYAGSERRSAMYQEMECLSCPHVWKDHFILVALVDCVQTAR